MKITEQDREANECYLRMRKTLDKQNITDAQYDAAAEQLAALVGRLYGTSGQQVMLVYYWCGEQPTI